MNINEFISLYRALAAVGLPGAVLLALYANQRGWWMWKREFDSLATQLKVVEDRVKELEVRLAFVEEEKHEWKDAALYGTRAARHAANAVRAAGGSEASS